MGEAGKSACASTLMSRACAQNALWRSQWVGLKNEYYYCSVVCAIEPLEH